MLWQPWNHCHTPVSNNLKENRRDIPRPWWPILNAKTKDDATRTKLRATTVMTLVLCSKCQHYDVNLLRFVIKTICYRAPITFTIECYQQRREHLKKITVQRRRRPKIGTVTFCGCINRSWTALGFPTPEFDLFWSLLRL